MCQTVTPEHIGNLFFLDIYYQSFGIGIDSVHLNIKKNNSSWGIAWYHGIDT